jgi:hypothetical protein
MTSTGFMRTKTVGELKRKITVANMSKELKRLVNVEGKTIREAAEELDIAESSARAIIDNDDKHITISVHTANWILTALILNWKYDMDEEK